MPKTKRGRSTSSNRSKASPFPKISTKSKQKESEIFTGTKEDINEWEEAKCPICMEHPHSAVRLQCSSCKNGCRPYMCNTGCRHSNCLNEFFKQFSVSSSTIAPRESPLSSSGSSPTEPEDAPDFSIIEPYQLNRSCGNHLQPKLECPLCRGEVTGWVIDEPARRFMNSRPRSCSFEKCDFIGTYAELRKHARVGHPFVQPWEVDQERNQKWIRLEHAREVQDVLSAIQSEHINLSTGEIDVSQINDQWVSLTLLARYYMPTNIPDDQSET